MKLIFHPPQSILLLILFGHQWLFPCIAFSFFLSKLSASLSVSDFMSLSNRLILASSCLICPACLLVLAVQYFTEIL